MRLSTPLLLTLRLPAAPRLLTLVRRIGLLRGAVTGLLLVRRVGLGGLLAVWAVALLWRVSHVSAPVMHASGFDAGTL